MHFRQTALRGCHMPESHAVQNRLLASLPPAVLARLLPRMTRILMPLRMPVYRPDTEMDAVYFVETGMISVVAMLSDGMQAEVGMIGPEGMAGSGLAAGNGVSFAGWMVQLAGEGYRMGAAEFRRELEAVAALRALILRYHDALFMQVAQTAACNGRHGLEQRLARWLLMAHDRVRGGELHLTQEFIAAMLGAHRPSVTVAAGSLQRAGLIRYSNGRMTVLDRLGLEAAACECYGTVQRRLVSMLGAAACQDMAMPVAS